MKKMNIAVLDYSGGTVSVYRRVEIEKTANQSEIIEDWLTANTEHHLSNCSWMSSENEIDIIEN